MANNSKSSSEIVDELLKELANKNVQGSKIDNKVERIIEEQVKMSEANIVKPEEIKFPKNDEKEQKRKVEKRNRKHKRCRSSDEDSSKDRKHHHKRKKKKSDDSKKKHKHKHLRRSKEKDRHNNNSRGKRIEIEEEIEWQSDPESKKSNNNIKKTRKIEKKPLDFPEMLKIALDGAVQPQKIVNIQHEVTNVEANNVCQVVSEEIVVLDPTKCAAAEGEKKIVCIVKGDEWGTNSEAEEDEDSNSRIEIKDIKDCFVLQGTPCPELGKEKAIADIELTHSSDTEGPSESGSNSKSKKKPLKLKKKKKSHRKGTNEHDKKRNSRSRSVSKSRKKSPSPRLKTRRKSRSRSRSKSSERRRHDRKQSSDHRDRQQRSHRHKSVERIRPKSRSPIRGVSREKIDKAKLLEIARKNAMMMVSQGQISATGRLLHSQQNTASLKSGGKSVAELTNFCKQLVTKGDSSSGDEDNANCATEEDGPFIQHPFKLKDPQPNIVMNIKNAVQVPVKTPAEKAAETAKLRIQFPVSSGSQHRKTESDWVPVNPNKKEGKSSPSPLPPAPPTPLPATISSGITTISLPLGPTDPLIFEQSRKHTQQAIDVSCVLSQRLKAITKLQENPNDVEALQLIYKVQQQLQSWTESKQLPGQFTGSTNAVLLTPEELAGPTHCQAWVKKDQFNKAPPVDGGMGMYLLRKMGWNPGEGLGKNKEGVTLPLILDIKMDKKGLTSSEETARKNAHVPVMRDLSGKHPVSALVELCSKRKWGPPDFILVHDSGPDHKKNFLFKVRVNNVDYQPSVASSNKKHAKAQAAIVCLQAMGLYPRDLNNPL